MDKRPNVRVPPERNEKLEAFRREVVGEEIRETMAADRLEQSYPRNNFAAGAAVIAGVLVLIGMAYLVGFVK